VRERPISTGSTERIIEVSAALRGGVRAFGPNTVPDTRSS